MYALENDTSAAVNRYGISRSTLDGWIERYTSQINTEKQLIKDGVLPVLPLDNNKARVYAPKYGTEIDKELLAWVTEARKNGLTIHPQQVRIMLMTLLKKHKIEAVTQYTEEWATYWLEKNNFSFRMGTTAKIENYEEDTSIKEEFQLRIATAILKYSVPKPLCYNIDQTGIHLIPVSNTTYEKRGAKQVLIKNKGDKQQFTLQLCGSASGELLPPQLIFKGKSERVHPTSLDNSWNITHSENHWANEDTFIEFIDKVLNPHRKKTIADLGLADNQVALVILDVWWVHRSIKVRSYLKKNGFEVEYVTPNYTWYLQPMDVTGGPNGVLKKAIRNEFETWHMTRLLIEMNTKPLSEISISLPMKEIRNSSISWISASLEIVKCGKHVSKGFVKAGILDAWSLELKRKAQANLSEQETVVDYNTEPLLPINTDVIESTRRTIQALKKSAKSKQQQSPVQAIDLSIPVTQTADPPNSKKRKRSIGKGKSKKKTSKRKGN